MDLAIVVRLYRTDSWVSQILSVSVTLLWIIVAFGTLRKLATGELLFAPCLRDLEGLKKERGERHFGEKAAWGTAYLAKISDNINPGGMLAERSKLVILIECSCLTKRRGSNNRRIELRFMGPRGAITFMIDFGDCKIFSQETERLPVVFLIDLYDSSPHSQIISGLQRYLIFQSWKPLLRIEIISAQTRIIPSA